MVLPAIEEEKQTDVKIGRKKSKNKKSKRKQSKKSRKQNRKKK